MTSMFLVIIEDEKIKDLRYHYIVKTDDRWEAVQIARNKYKDMGQVIAVLGFYPSEFDQEALYIGATH